MKQPQIETCPNSLFKNLMRFWPCKTVTKIEFQHLRRDSEPKSLKCAICQSQGCQSQCNRQVQGHESEPHGKREWRKKYATNQEGSFRQDPALPLIPHDIQQVLPTNEASVCPFVKRRDRIKHGRCIAWIPLVAKTGRRHSVKALPPPSSDCTSASFSTFYFKKPHQRWPEHSWIN